MTFTDTDGVLTDTQSVKEVTIPAGQPSQEFGFVFASGGIQDETFSVTLTSSDTTVATVASGQDTLTFNLVSISEGEKKTFLCSCHIFTCSGCCNDDNIYKHSFHSQACKQTNTEERIRNQLKITYFYNTSFNNSFTNIDNVYFLLSNL